MNLRRGLLFLLLVIFSNIAQAEKNIQINFMTEVQGFKLLDIAKDTATISKLKELNAQLYVGITDFSEDRISALKIFKKNGIACHAWLLLPKGEHYWPNAHNGARVLDRFNKFNAWSTKNRLHWQSLTLSLSPYSTDSRIVDNGPISVSKVILKRLISGSVQHNGELNYVRLRSVATQAGYKVFSIISPYQIDAKEVNVDTWKQISGTFDMLNDQEILSIFNYYQEDTPHTLAQIKAYQSGFNQLIIGSANAKKPLSKEDNNRVLTWDELSNYITLARQYDKNIIIYGLEGAIENQLLNKLSLHIVDSKLPNLKLAEEDVLQERENTQVLFTILAHPGWITFALFFIGITFCIALLRTLKLLF